MDGQGRLLYYFPTLATTATRRGLLGAPIFTLNQFLVGGSPELSATINANPFLIDHARDCQKALDHIPNFVAVDYYDEGDLFAAVRALNGL